MTRPQHLLYTAAEAEAEEGDTDNDDLAQNPVVASETSKAELTKSSTADDDNDSRKSSISTNSRRASPGSGEGYTADCSSDASSDPSSELSGSAKKHSKDNMILASVTKLSIKENEDDDQSNEDSAEGGTKEKSVHNHANNNKKKKKRRKRTAHHSHSRSHTKHKNHHTNQDRSGSSGSGSDMADVEDGNVPAQAVQWNGVKVVHPMDPRIDISKVGYIYQSPVSTGPSSSDDASGGGSGTGNGSCPQSQHQEETPSMEHYMQLMEVSCVQADIVRPSTYSCLTVCPSTSTLILE